MLSLALFAAASATVIHWFSPVRQWMDLIVPPGMCVVFATLLMALLWRPPWIFAIVRIALLFAALALIAPAWFYTVQAALTPGLSLVGTYPPVSSLLVVLMVMIMLFTPGRRAFRLATLAWVLIALPVLVYLLLHRQEMWSPRGRDLLMAYGPVIVMIVVLLPVQRGLSGKIDRLVSERARMEILVNRDPLTRIYNRRLGEQFMQGVLDAHAAAGVIMFDLDHFKMINDTHGHPVGDLVLQVVAKRCRAVLRENACVSRWGGEEFMVIVPDLDAAGTQQAAERLRSAIALTPILPVRRVTASFGITLMRADDKLAYVLQRVDQALYQAKQQGGDSIVWAPAGYNVLRVADP